MEVATVEMKVLPTVAGMPLLISVVIRLIIKLKSFKLGGLVSMWAVLN